MQDQFMIMLDKFTEEMGDIITQIDNDLNEIAEFVAYNETEEAEEIGAQLLNVFLKISSTKEFKKIVGQLSRELRSLKRKVEIAKLVAH